MDKPSKKKKLGRPVTGKPNMDRVQVWLPGAIKKKLYKVAGPGNVSNYARKAIEKQVKKDLK